MAETLIPGEVARLPIRVTTLSGLDADPGAIALKVMPPSGAVTDYIYSVAPEIVRDGTGQYHADIPLSAAGRYYYRWELAAPNAGAVEGAFTVQPSRFIQS